MPLVGDVVAGFPSPAEDYAEQFTLKRLELHEDHAYLVPSNNNYDPIYVDGETQFSVWGVVCWVIKKV